MVVVAWSVQFARDVDNLLAYLENKGASAAIRKILKQIDQKSELIAKYPESGQPSNKIDNVRSVKLDKFHRIYYQTYPGTLVLIALLDLRQDPGNNPF